MSGLKSRVFMQWNIPQQQKRAKVVLHTNMNKSQKYYAESRKTYVREHIVYESNYMKF